jgi:DNA (cytosine-5)-methyltransferase 1
MGLHLAGWDVVGVDTEPQPRYPFEFHQADAMTYPLEGFDLITGSPPCHDHTVLKGRAGTNGTGWMLAALRERMQAQPAPWMIENVPGAPMRPDFMLCGSMFGLRTYRHRWFEIDPRLPILIGQPPHPRHRIRTVSTGRAAHWAAGGHVTVTGDIGSYVGPAAMGIDWMTGDELSQAIPPAYTRYIGRQLLENLPKLV